MKRIRISEATYRAIAEASIMPFQSTGKRQPDGTWIMPIEDDTFERLQRHRLPGENDDDIITRMIHAYYKRPTN